MADLLECLLQIKALGLTPGRLRTVVDSKAFLDWHRQPEAGTPSGWQLVAHLLRREQDYEAALHRALDAEGGERLAPSGAPPSRQTASSAREPDRSPGNWESGASGEAGNREARETGAMLDAVERFAGERRRFVERLDRCTAADLSRATVFDRRQVTVADLVAIALASDVETIGQLRERTRD